MFVIPNAAIEADIRDSFAIRKLNGGLYAEKCRLAYHRIILIHSGSGSIQIDDRTYPVSGHELFLVSKGQILATS